MLNNIYKNKTIFISGNTGFVGSNMTLFLLKLGARIIGYSDKTYPHFNELTGLNLLPITQYYGKVEDFDKLKKAVDENSVDMIIHLGSQPLVKESYKNPRQTYETNMLGILNLLEILRLKNSNIPLLNITTDKCYKNVEQIWGYKETDELNGYDPYSNSKSISELITEGYRNSFFNLDGYGKTHNTLIATGRAGNIIGMGDFGEYRLVPDIIKAWDKKETVDIRYPNAVRPWTFVLDIINGYLMLGAKLLEGKKEFAEAWNFSSELQDQVTVEEIIKKINKYIPVDYKIDESNRDKETTTLRLDYTKAKLKLKWSPWLDIDENIEWTVEWYKRYYEDGKIITEDLIDDYFRIVNLGDIIEGIE